MNRIYRYTLLLACLCAAGRGWAQVTFYDLNTIQKIEISFTQANWDYQMDTAKSGAGGYLMAQYVKLNGTQYDSVGVKYKGNSSYDSSKVKNPLHINLKKYKSGQNHQGLTDIKLANCYQDPSMIREVLSYAILKNYMDCPRSNFAQVYINGSYIGLYSNDEDINKAYVTGRFGSYTASTNSFFKCSHDNPSPTTKSNLKYISSDSTQYYALYELESNKGWGDLVKLCDTVTNYTGSAANYIDIDRVIWMLAFNNVLVNLDSYSGLFSQNYYVFKDNTGHFNPIVWDLNMSLGGFPFAGSQGGGTGSLTATGMQQLSPILHAADTDWPLINLVMNNPMYKRMYIAHMRTIVSEMFAGNSYVTQAQQLQSVIDTAVQSDVNKFFSYTQFQNGLTASTTVGSYAVPGIGTLMAARVSYLQGTAEFAQIPPDILSVASSNYTPSVNSSVTITAHITNANSSAVYLGYRFDSTKKFTRVLMYDDGAHGDGAANDNVYGASITMSTAYAQYYVYAENGNAGIFSPQRAEHEFYKLPNAAAGIAASVATRNLLKVYPNPAGESITIEPLQLYGSRRMEIRNALGQLMYTGSLDRTTVINTVYWASGTYFLHCGSYYNKIVILH